MIRTDVPAFSLMQGGPVTRILRRRRLAGESLEWSPLSAPVMLALAWLPLAFIAAAEGTFSGLAVTIPFVHDVEAHVRLLVALPLLLLAEPFVDQRLSPLIGAFAERGIVEPDDLPAFSAATRSTMRVAKARAVEIGVLVFVYTVGLWLWRRGLVPDASSWYMREGVTGRHLTRAGVWYAFVAIPMFQFVLVRWYVRIGLWASLLWRISRFPLHLTVAHPDRTGGIGFLAAAVSAFSPVFLAQGTLLSGLIAGRIMYGGESLASFATTVPAVVGVLLMVALVPLLFFAPQLDRARRYGGAKYGQLANRIVFGFEQKWIGDAGRAMPARDDLRTLADMCEGFVSVGDMRIVPFTARDVARVTIAIAMPLLPLALTVFSLPELVARAAKLLL